MPTLNFFLYLGALALAWLFRISYRGWFAPFLFWSLAAAPVLILLFSLPAMLTMRLTLETPPSVTRGEKGELRLRFSARSFLPVGAMRLQISAKNRFTGKMVNYTPRYYNLRRGSASFAIPTDACGALLIQVQRWECRDLLGLLRIGKRCPSPVVCVVMPVPHEPEPMVDFEAALQTQTRLRPKYGGGFAEEHELREYRPGDMSNSIHWKLSSKADKLIVREAQEEANKDIFVVLSGGGADEDGLDVLYWLTLALLQRELPHRIAANALYSVGNETEAHEALMRLLSSPLSEPAAFDGALARCIFRVVGREVLLP